MEEGLRIKIESLRRLKTKELKARYRDLFGEESPSSNRAHLFRRIAWRLQAQAEGDLSEQARRRACELAKDADLRLRAPRHFWREIDAHSKRPDAHGGRLMVNPREADRVREIFTICVGCPTLAAAQREVDARGLRTKDWTSARGRRHRASSFTPSRLGALLSNILYIGQIRHKGVVYAGEQPAIVDRELWLQVQEQLKPGARRGARHKKLDALLAGLLYCAHCGEQMGASFTSRHGCRHLYYVCRAGKKRTLRCSQEPVATSDLESSLFEKLEAILGADASTILLDQALERIVYDSKTREVGVALRDRSRFQYLLPVANRPGVSRRVEEPMERGRVPRVSRLMALAVKFQGLVEEGAFRNAAELASLGHITRARLCQIMMLANLAPSIQEALLFLPKTLHGPDRLTERQLRHIARIVDWEAQQRLFRSCWGRVGLGAIRI